jgi:hypothetical protein
MDAPIHIEAMDGLLTTMEAEFVVGGQPAAVAGDQVDSGQRPAAIVAEQVDTLDESLEAVQLELALHNQNLISLGFEFDPDSAEGHWRRDAVPDARGA